jgi:fatty-acyl-CoA synthase
MQDAGMTATSAVLPGSYASGTSAVPLLGETIGANLEATAARFAGKDVTS